MQVRHEPGLLQCLRCVELKSIKYGELKDNEDVWGTYEQAKQKGEKKQSKVLILFNRKNAPLCLA